MFFGFRRDFRWKMFRSHIVCVSNLASTVTEPELRTFFGRRGLQPQSMIIMPCHRAYVSFGTEAVAQQAVALNGQQLAGLCVTVLILTVVEVERMRNMFGGFQFMCYTQPMNAAAQESWNLSCRAFGLSTGVRVPGENEPNVVFCNGGNGGVHSFTSTTNFFNNGRGGGFFP